VHIAPKLDSLTNSGYKSTSIHTFKQFDGGQRKTEIATENDATIATPAAEPDNSITPGVIAGEVRDFMRAHESRRRQFPRAALVGLLAGLLAVGFRRTLELFDGLRNGLIAFGHLHPEWGFLIPITFCATGAGIGVFLVQRFAPEVAGSGIPHLKSVLHRFRSMSWKRILLVKFTAGALSIGSGMALGREGPTVQMGGAVGQMVNRWLGGTVRERQTLIAAGAGAGLAAAFNAPLAGVIFVLEELQRDFAPTVFTAAFVACVVADVVARLLGGQLPAFHVASLPLAPLKSLPVFVILGVVSGVLGVGFNRALVKSLNLFARANRWPLGAAGALVGAGVGLVGWFIPEALGGGHVLVEQTLAGQAALGGLALLFILRFAMTMASYGSGAAGGIFAPLLVLGAQIGLLIGLLAARCYPAAAPEPAMFAVVGMAAYFTAIVRAPLTGIVLIVEMTGNYSLMLPLLAACFCAYGVADALGDTPVYEALLERDLLRSGIVPQLKDNLLLELPLQPGAPFENKQIRELGLPAGCIVITIGRGLHNHVATAETVLLAGDRITAVIAPQAGASAALLRQGTERARA
jgi:CIC family chloride channel protein